jgi:TolA-binding protein
MGIGEVLMEKKDYKESINVLRQVVRLPNSHSRAKAQFLIATAMERTDDQDRAIREYTTCAKRFPDSEYAGPALAKVIDYHVKTGALTEADDLLEQVFVDYQDEDFLDSMLLKWVLVAYQNGDYKKAHEKCTQLINEYPGSVPATKAEQVLPKIKKMLGTGDSKKEKTDEK